MIRFSLTKFFWTDESLTYYTVLGKTLSQLLRFQASTPIVFEPPTNDILLLGSSKLLGMSVLALRLPSVLFFLLTQVLVYKLVQRRFGTLPGIIAAGLLLIVGARSFGAEARPYQLIICTAVAALYSFVVSSESREKRLKFLAYAGITCSIALATTSQFYGVLVALPIIVAAVYHDALKRQISRGFWIAMLLGLASVFLDYPFFKAVQQYQAHFVREAGIGYRYFVETYTLTLRPLPQRLTSIRHLQSSLYIVVLATAVAASYPSKRESITYRAMWAGWVSLAFIPLPVLTIAYFITKTYSPRHSIEFVGGLAPLLIAAVFTQVERGGPLVRKTVAVVMLVLVIVAVLRWQTSLKQNQTQQVAMHKTAPAMRAALEAHSQLPIYLTIEECLEFPFYGEKQYTSRVRCVFSLEREIRFDHQVISSKTAQAIAQHTQFPLPFETYEQMRSNGDVYLAYLPVPWMTWLAKSLEQDHAAVMELGTGFGGEMEQVHFPTGR